MPGRRDLEPIDLLVGPRETLPALALLVLELLELIVLELHRGAVAAVHGQDLARRRPPPWRSGTRRDRRISCRGCRTDSGPCRRSSPRSEPPASASTSPSLLTSTASAAGSRDRLRRQHPRVLRHLEHRLALLVARIELRELHLEAVARIAREQPEIVGLADQHRRERGAVRRIDACRTAARRSRAPPAAGAHPDCRHGRWNR